MIETYKPINTGNIIKLPYAERERERERERKRERQRERDRERKNFILTRTVRSYGNGEIYDYDSWLFINAQLYRVNSLRENDICT